jgi:hypothetical protein
MSHPSAERVPALPAAPRRIAAGLRDRALDALGTLRSVFLIHHAKEEWLIHPRLVEAVTPATEEAVVRWLIEP